MGILSSLNSYSTKWVVKHRESFSKAELDILEPKAEIQKKTFANEDGNKIERLSICLVIKDDPQGTKKFLPVSEQPTREVKEGDIVNVKDIECEVLEKAGSKDTTKGNFKVAAKRGPKKTTTKGKKAKKA